MNSNRSNKLKKEKIFFWASDFKSNTGEGRLGRLYIEYIKHKINKKIIKISSPKNNFLNHKYIVPFTGIFICWLYFFKNKKSYLCKLSTILEFFNFPIIASKYIDRSNYRWCFI